MRLLIFAFFVVAFPAATIAADNSDKDVIGRWYRGNHLDYNVLLIISPDHTYKADWFGDLDDSNGHLSFRKEAGKWALQGDQLVVKPFKDTKGGLKTMGIIRRHLNVYLAPIRSRELGIDPNFDPIMVFERESR